MHMIHTHTHAQKRNIRDREFEEALTCNLTDHVITTYSLETITTTIHSKSAHKRQKEGKPITD